MRILPPGPGLEWRQAVSKGVVCKRDFQGCGLVWGRRACVTTAPPPWRRGQQALLSLPPPAHPVRVWSVAVSPPTSPTTPGIVSVVTTASPLLALRLARGNSDLLVGWWMGSQDGWSWASRGLVGENQHGGRGWPPLRTILPGEAMRLGPECLALSQALHCPPRESLKPCSHASVIFPALPPAGPRGSE